jgi:2-oxoglutarate dehydrogenase E1 component
MKNEEHFINTINHLNIDYIEKSYQNWNKNPYSLSKKWNSFFQFLSKKNTFNKNLDKNFFCNHKDNKSINDYYKINLFKEIIKKIIKKYYQEGHNYANINPLNYEKKYLMFFKKLKANYSLMKEIPKNFIFSDKIFCSGRNIKFKKIIKILNYSYCNFVGYQISHIKDKKKLLFLRRRIEENSLKNFDNILSFPEYKIIGILKVIIKSELFEQFLHTRYRGQKRFSLEGSESILIILNQIITCAIKNNLEEIYMGMPHRGRINILANFFQKEIKKIMMEFEEILRVDHFDKSGDVKYHLGYNSNLNTKKFLKLNCLKNINGKLSSIYISLLSNPSHLEYIDPVVHGKVKARQLIKKDILKKRIIPILIHGDASFCGQGIVSEIFNMSKLKGYTVGGTIHIIINNQIGFTTSSKEGRSNQYCTDVCKMNDNVPIFHVNSECLEEMINVTNIAFEYRQKFGEDVVIDLYSYRFHGHNEMDDPNFTNPLMYQKIYKKNKLSKIIIDKYLKNKEKILEKIEKFSKRYYSFLEEEYKKTRLKKLSINKEKMKEFRNLIKDELFPDNNFNIVKTSKIEKSNIKINFDKKIFKKIGKFLVLIPKDFNVHPIIRRKINERKKMIGFEKKIDWSFAEFLAFGSLIYNGINIRISGQDSVRGTFSQRHAIIYDQKNGKKFSFLKELSSSINYKKPNKCGQFSIYNSSLSEISILGFELGYSIGHNNSFSKLKKNLVIWEAQFGDFSNSAQVIIDQFIVSQRDKWSQISRLVLLLPHGYEGQGPEHSSSRIERFLQSCSKNNIRVCNPTTPSQYFHLIRSQILIEDSNPLIVMTPKSLLRNQNCTSYYKDFLEKNSFKKILVDLHNKKLGRIIKIIFCSGKIYYDFCAFFDKEDNNYFYNKKNTMVIRIEQLYPFDFSIFKFIKKFKNCSKFIWLQEEPKNMGCWNFIKNKFLSQNIILNYVGRRSSPSPSSGSFIIHNIQQSLIIRKAIEL